MPYKKPMCNCGSELVWWSQPTYTDIYSIKKNGYVSKKPIQHSYDGEGPWVRLECPECNKEYDFDFDDKGRIVRCEEWDKSPYNY